MNLPALRASASDEKDRLTTTHFVVWEGEAPAEPIPTLDSRVRQEPHPPSFRKTCASGFPAKTRRRREQAFTIRELAVVLTVLAGLLLLHLPSRANGKTLGRSFGCLSNQRQLVLAWLMYAEENAGVLPSTFQAASTPPWVAGSLDFNGRNPVNTNVQFLLNPQFASMGPYTRNAALYRCPEDQSQVRIDGAWYPRVRSYAMNAALGDGGSFWLPSPPYRAFRSIAEIVAPSPRNLFVIIDEHPDSINDGSFAVQMADPENSGNIRIINYPASFHNGGASFSFADGHADFHRWTDPRTKPPIRYNASLALNIASPNNRDMLWLSERTSSRRR